MLGRFRHQLAKHLSKDTLKDSDAAESSDSTASAAARYIETLKESALLLEYGRLQSEAPAGVYVMPVSGNFRRWHGVIFVRKGFYRRGVFRFLVTIPPQYPDVPPSVRFVGDLFHPMVSASNGEIDLRAVTAFPDWTLNQHFLMHVLAYVKKIFYKTEWWEDRHASAAGTATTAIPTSTAAAQPSDTIPGDGVLNRSASSLFSRQRDEFARRVDRCCQSSLDSLYEYADGFALHFTRPTRAHEECWNRISQSIHAGHDITDGQPQFPSYLPWFEDGPDAIRDDTAPVDKPSRVSVSDAELASWRAESAALGPGSPVLSSESSTTDSGTATPVLQPEFSIDTSDMHARGEDAELP